MFLELHLSVQSLRDNDTFYLNIINTKFTKCPQKVRKKKNIAFNM